jgi:uncharacterized membrane protein
MLGSRIVLAWIMIVGVAVGLPVAVASPAPSTVSPATIALLLLAGSCYVVGLQLTYAALRVGKVSIVAPIVSTEGAVAALVSIALGDPIGFIAGVMLVAIAAGVVLSSLDRARPASSISMTRRQLRVARLVPASGLVNQYDAEAAPVGSPRPGYTGAS